MNIFSKKAFYIAFKGLCYAIFCFLRGLNVSWRKRNFRNNGPVLLFTALFTKRRTLKFKAIFTIDFFAAVNYNYNPKQWALNHRNTQSGWKSTNHKLWPFEPVKFCFPRGPLKWLRQWKMQMSVGFWTSEFACFWKVQQYFIEALRLFPVTCWYKWQGWTWIETWKTWANFFNF